MPANACQRALLWLFVSARRAARAQFFLERRVSETALETARQHRKIILLRDFIAALSLNKNPQALQVFIGAHARRTPPKRACVR
eukprot:6186587-Pleurochrysis_carterae.AAC.4